MKLYQLIFPLTLASIVVAGCVRFGAQNSDVYSASFGLLDAQDHLTPANRIPYRLGLRYGWKLTAHTSKSTVRVKEIFKLPGNAPWAGNLVDSEKVKNIKQKLSESGDLSEKVSEVKIGPQEETEILQPYWFIEGDPQGTYSISIFVENKFITNFTFQVFSEQ